MRSAAIALAAGLILAAPAIAEEPVIVEGYPRIIDGDSLKVDGTRIRLYGIDAPEANQECLTVGGEPWHCGTAATLELAGVLGDSDVRCLGMGLDRYKRLLALCWVLKGHEPAADTVNASMVAKGYAIRFRDRDPNFETEERYARDSQIGIWSGSFIPPAEWRRTHRRPLSLDEAIERQREYLDRTQPGI